MASNWVEEYEARKTWVNKLFYGDNLDILRERIPAESVDLIYLDPPFNSNRSYNVLFADKWSQSPSQGTCVAPSALSASTVVSHPRGPPFRAAGRAE